MSQAMRRVGFLVFSSFVLLGGCAASGPSNSPPTPEDLRSTIEHRWAEYTADLRRSNAPAVAAYFTEDGLLSTANGPALQGRPQIQAALEQAFDTTRVLRMQMTPEHVSRAGDRIYDFGGFEELVQISGPLAVRSQGHYAALWHAGQGGWLLERLLLVRLEDVQR